MEGTTIESSEMEEPDAASECDVNATLRMETASTRNAKEGIDLESATWQFM